MTELQRLRKELEKCQARNVAMLDVVEAARELHLAMRAIDFGTLRPAGDGEWQDLLDRRDDAIGGARSALEAYDKAIEKEGTG